MPDKLFPEDQPGEVNQAIGGHMAIPSWGCPGPCGILGPQVFTTVSGATGTINWANNSWTLPGQSGLRQSSCPDNYQNERIYDPDIVVGGALASQTQTQETWSADPTFSEILQLRVQTIETQERVGTRFRSQTVTHEIIVAGVTDRLTRRDDYATLPAQPGTDPPYEPPFTGGQFLGTTIIENTVNLGLLSFPISGDWLNYRIPDSFFTSVVLAGITYQWERGDAWSPGTLVVPQVI